MSRVDVLIPCYKYGRYLRACVESLLAQSLADLRILILDDASPDETPEVAAALVRQDPRVEYRRHATNQGHIATYNEGLEWVQGDYVLLISADDLVTPGALRRAVGLLDARPEVALAYGRDIAFDTDQPPPTEGGFPEECGWKVLSYAEFLEKACALGQTGIQAPTVVVRTSVHKRVGGYRKELPHAADTEIWLRLAAHGAVGVLDADQAFLRIHRQNMKFSYSPLRRLQEQKAAFDAHFREFGSHVADWERLEGLLNRTLAEAAFWGASRAFDERDGESCQGQLAFALAMNPAIRHWRPWCRFRWKRLLGARICSTLRALDKWVRNQGAGGVRLHTSARGADRPVMRREGASMHNILYCYSSQQVHTGSPRVLIRLIEALDRDLFTPFFLADREGDLSRELERRGVRLVEGSTGSLGKRSLCRNVCNVIRLGRSLRRYDIALVHINEIGWNSELAVAARLLQIPIIFHIHNPEPMSRRNINCRIGTRYLFVSEETARQCQAEAVVGVKGEVVHNPTPVGRFAAAQPIRNQLGVPGNAPVIGTVAQISRRKGIDILIETAANVLADVPEARFLIVGPNVKGEEGYAAEMRQRVSALGLGRRVLFLGPRDDVPAFLASIDLFFLPTRSEGFPLVIAEAMSAKVPVVTSNVGGIPEMIPDNSCGVASPIDVGGFHRSIVALLAAPERRQSMAQLAFKRVTSLFSDQAFNKRIKLLYEALLPAGVASPPGQ